MVSHDGTKSLPTSGRPTPPKLNVVVVEEFSSSRMIYIQVAASLGSHIQVHGFRKSTQALMWMRTNTAALVMCNLWMAELNAFELVALLRKQLNYVTVPILVVTSDTSDGLPERVIAAGASDLLMIPAPIHEMRHRLQCLLGPDV